MARRAEGRSEVRRAQRRHPSLDEGDRRQARPQGRRAGRRAAAALPELRGPPARPALRVGRAGDRAVTGPATLRLSLLRDLDEAFGRAYCRWPGEPPRWLVDAAAEVEIRFHQAERRLARSGGATKAAPAGAPSRRGLR